MIKHSTTHKQISKVLLALLLLLTLVIFSIKSVYAQQLTTINVKANTATLIEEAPKEPLKNLAKVLQQKPLTLVGSAKFSVLFWDIYHSHLYTPSGEYLVKSNNNGMTEKSPSLLFEIQYLRDITKQDLITRTIEQWQHLAITAEQYNKFIPVLEAIWPDIKTDDSLALLIDNNLSHFYFNGNHIGTIAHASFGPLFTAIWLDPNTSQPKLRAKLIGENK
ncbi:chalcone isomerase family protein [Colwellia sp. D2M02]|uniref:chalcone isomerase family protein n=1 Tax=Colwellia sp. D2M02 TaxID=2841562 RepID=UPI001C09E7EC|nr:chalcone isomerase family protein [Colwellia sp. D2M02]MBU2891869.1 chalcone isomerase family protein [Colwellia sp. D2M02]